LTGDDPPLPWIPLTSLYLLTKTYGLSVKLDKKRIVNMRFKLGQGIGGHEHGNLCFPGLKDKVMHIALGFHPSQFAE